MAFPANPTNGDTHDAGGYRFTYNSGRWERTRAVLSIPSDTSDPPNVDDLPLHSVWGREVHHASGGHSRPLLLVSEGAGQPPVPIGAEAECIGHVETTNQLDHRGITGLGAYERVLITGFLAGTDGEDIWMRMVNKANGYLTSAFKHTSRTWWGNGGNTTQKGWSGHWYNIGRAGMWASAENVEVYIEIIGNRGTRDNDIAMHVSLVGRSTAGDMLTQQSYLNIVNTTIHRVDFRIVGNGNANLRYIGYRTQETV